jgi:hypothetical protein
MTRPKGSPYSRKVTTAPSLVLRLSFTVELVRREDSVVLADSQQKLAELRPGVLAIEA